MVELPHDNHAAIDLIECNLTAGRFRKAVYIDAGSCACARFAECVDGVANMRFALGARREERIAIAMLDSSDWAGVHG